MNSRRTPIKLPELSLTNTRSVAATALTLLGFLYLIALVAYSQDKVVGEPLEWDIYLAAGALLPLLALGMRGLPTRSLSWVHPLPWLVAAATVVVSSQRLFSTVVPPFGETAVFTMLTMGAAFLTVSLLIDQVKLERSSRLFPELLLAWAMWVGASKYFWMPAYPWYSQAAHPALWHVLLVLATNAVWLKTRRNHAEKSTIKDRVIDATILLYLVIVAYPGISLANVGTLRHHWSFYIGPIRLLREGGHLLWSVPSQYGFLSILLPASIPQDFIPMVFRWLVSGFGFVMAALIYRSLSRTNPGTWWRIAAGFYATVFVYFAPGWVTTIEGFWTYPSVAGYRFLPAMLLSVLLTATVRREFSPRWLVGTAILFALSCLWSAESAFYSVTVLAFFTFGLLISYLPCLEIDVRRSGVYWQLAACAGALLLAVMLIEAYYRFALGHGPEWFAILEYPLAYKSGFGAEPIHAEGLSLLLAAVFATLVATTLRGADSLRQLLSMAPYCGFFFAAASYFISRSHENNAINLTPCLVWSVSQCCWLAAESRTRRGESVLRGALLAVSTGILLLVINSGVLGDRLLRGFSPRKQEASREVYPPHNKSVYFAQISELIGERRFSSLASDMTYEEWNQLTRPWLPILPRHEFTIIDRARQLVYLERYLADIGYPAGALVHKKNDNDYLTLYLPLLEKYYQIASSHPVAEDYVLEIFNRKPK